MASRVSSESADSNQLANIENSSPPRSTPATGQSEYHQDEIVIALMGVTGSGKSTFIQNVTGQDDVLIGHTLFSETSECKAYPFKAHGINFSLIDTLGFDDTYLDDAAILEELANFMAMKYRSGIHLTAIIYLHPINHERLQGSARDNLALFQSLCGAEFFPNIVLATTFWDLVDESTGALRQAQLVDTSEFWGDMVRRGSRVIRLPNEHEACVELLLELVRTRKAQMALKIQVEMVLQERAVGDTEAAASTQGLREWNAMLKQCEKELKVLEREEDDIRRRQQEEDERESSRLGVKREEEERRKDEEHEKEIEDLRLWEVELDKRRMEHQREERAREEREAMLLSDLKRVERNRERHRRTVIETMGKITRAIRLGDTSAKMSQKFWGLGIPRCDFCQNSCSAQLSYFCEPCQDYTICSTCYDEGKRCLSEDHEFLSRRSFIGTTAGRCERMRGPAAVNCDRCGDKVDVLYFHCCRCKLDDFDLCWSCFTRGRQCLSRTHTLELLWV